MEQNLLWGYRRPDGRVGIRNHVLVLPTIVCATQAAKNVTELVQGTVSFIHQHGCAQVGVDYDQTFRTYVGMGTNPNVYGVIVMGLGCETHQEEVSLMKLPSAESRLNLCPFRIMVGLLLQRLKRPRLQHKWYRMPLRW